MIKVCKLLHVTLPSSFELFLKCSATFLSCLMPLVTQPKSRCNFIHCGTSHFKNLREAVYSGREASEAATHLRSDTTRSHRGENNPFPAAWNHDLPSAVSVQSSSSFFDAKLLVPGRSLPTSAYRTEHRLSLSALLWGIHIPSRGEYA